MYENSVNQRYQVPLQAIYPEQIREAVNASQQQAAMQGIDSEALKQRVEDNYTVNRVSDVAFPKETKELLAQYALAVPIWYGLSQSMDVFARKCRGEYKDTIQYRIGNLGDRMVDKFNGTRLGKSSAVSGIKNGVKSLSGWLNRNIVQKSAVLRAFTSTPSTPYHKMVDSQAKSMIGFLGMDYPQITENFVKPLKYAEDLDCYGADKNFIQKIKNQLANAPDASAKKMILEQAEFELVAPKGNKAKFASLPEAKRAEALRNLKARRFGFNNIKHMEKLMKHPHENVDELIKCFQKADKNMYSKIWVHDNSRINKVKGHLIGRKVYASECANKFIGSLGKKNTFHKSWIGKMMPKLSNIFLEGATNRVAGGKLVAAMQAFFLAECLIKTAQAQGVSEKVKTFAERFTELVGFFIATPIAIQLLHKMGGIQYAGISESFVKEALTKFKGKKLSAEELNAAQKVIKDFQEACKTMKPHEAYVKVLKEFNKSAFAAEFTKAQHKGGFKALKFLRKGDTRNPITKLFKKAARVITVGLEQIAPYRKKGITVFEGGFFKQLKTVALDLFKHPKYWLKQGAGYPMRFLLVMMSIMPFINNLGVKAIHKIFGRPEHSVLDKEEDENEKNNPAKNFPAQPIAGIPIEGTVSPETLNNSNYIKKYMNGEAVNSSSSAPVRSYIPSPERVKLDNDEPLRTYVPSPQGALINNNTDTSAADAALMRADAVEKNVMEVLGIEGKSSLF